MRTLAISSAIFLRYVTILVIFATCVVEAQAQNVSTKGNHDNIADQLNQQQVSRRSLGSVPPQKGGRVDEVGILFCEGTGAIRMGSVWRRPTIWYLSLARTEQATFIRTVRKWTSTPPSWRV